VAVDALVTLRGPQRPSSVNTGGVLLHGPGAAPSHLSAAAADPRALFADGPRTGQTGLPVNTANLRYLFHPESVALVGASNDPTKWGGLILTSLLSGGFPGRIYPVNPHAERMFGLEAYAGLAALPEAPELVLAAVRADLVPGVVEECGRLGVKALVVITAGFEETGTEGAAAARGAAEIASRYGLVMVGPNSLGVMCAQSRLYATGASVLQPKPGPASFASQSGSMGVQLMSAAERHKAGAGKYVGVGNEAQVNVAHFIDYFREDPDTGVVLAYIEGVRDGRRLLDSLRRCTAEKPVLLLRGGASEYGGRAAASHTGAMAGSQEVFEALVRQSGVSCTTDPSEFLDLTYCFSYLPLPRGSRVAVVSVGGGWGVVAADEIARQGLELAKLEPAVMDRLNALLPPFWSHGNPVDLAGMFTERREPEESVYAVTPSEEVDAVIVIGVLGIVAQPERTVEAITRMKLRYGWDASDIKMPDTNVYMEREIVFLQRVCALMEEYGKPILNVPFAPTPQYVYDMDHRYSAVLLPTATRAVRCIAQMARYAFSVPQCLPGDDTAPAS
jgi:acyl-CoA synthetase (NDP forming)